MSSFETGAAAQTVEAAAQMGAHAGARMPTASVLDEFSSALASAHSALSNFLDLLSLEARRAGLMLTWMIVCGVVAAICVVTAWLGLMVAVAMAAMSLGVPTPAAVIAVAVINGATGVVLIYICIGMSKSLLFSATRRQLAGQCPMKPSAS
ncbi:MAG: hypothetical protein H7252_05705 [Cytophaga sp.]|nr:hypothetical protein [Undibacterium sp.]